MGTSFVVLTNFNFLHTCLTLVLWVPGGWGLYDNIHIRTALCLFIYLGFYIAFNTVQVISQLVVGRAEETSTYSSLGFCTVNCRPMASNYQLSHLRPYRESNPGLRGGSIVSIHICVILCMLSMW